MGLFSRENKAGQVDLNNLPCHVAVIMDGNGRWAQKRGLPRSAGHKAGAETFRKLGTYCKHLGIDYLTVYAFSTENWKRPKDEVDGIMRLLEQYLHECIDTMEKDGNRLRFLGDLSVLTPELREKLRHLLNFKFKKHSRYNLPENRLRMVERQVQKRARILLNME